MLHRHPAARYSLLTLSLLGAGLHQAHASGFALIEQNASGLGNAYAGQAASAQDASTVFFNPAGMTKVQGTQLVMAGNLILPTARFNDSGASTVATVLQTTKGGDGGDAGGLALAPNFYYVRDLKPDLKLGIGVSAPFGLGTEYDETWMGRFQAVKSDLKTINVNPSLAYKLSDTVSVGAGLDLMTIEATLTKMTNYSAAIVAGGGPAIADLSGLSKMKGDDWGIGYNFGVLFEPAPDTRIGLGYRSRVQMELEGSVSFQNVPITGNAVLDAALAATFANGDVTAKVTLPDSFSASFFKKLNERVDLLADASWTNWSVFRELKIDRTSGANVSTTPENWEDTWRFSLGMNYRQDDRLTWRAGVAYDQSPVPDQWRTPRIPDQDRTWVAVGFQYTMADKSKWDVGYAHLFVKNPSMNMTVAGQGTLSGSYDNSVDILSVQYTRNF